MNKIKRFTICFLFILAISLSFIIVACNDTTPPDDQIPDTPPPPVTETEMVTVTYRVERIEASIEAEKGTETHPTIKIDEIFEIVSYTIPKGSDIPTVTVIPRLGYKFLCWTDGGTNPQRTDINITEDIMFDALFNKLYYDVTYSAAEGGRVESEFGAIFLEYSYGTQLYPVTAIPDEDYIFDKWNDGYTEPQRTDTVIRSQDLVAIFKRVSKTFYYEYNHADENCNEEKVVFHFDTPLSPITTFPTPKRINSIFKGWYLEKDFKTKVADENGKLLLGEELYESESNNLYAKYDIIEQLPAYKILMVYVTEVEGTFELESGENKYIHYTMTDLEKQVFRVLTKVFENKLNDMFCGLVTFEVDELFTQDVVTEKEVSCTAFKKDYHLYANQIPEISKDILDKYRSVITSIQLGDKYENDRPIEQRLHSGRGNAWHKYACVFTEGAIQDLDDSLQYTLNDLLDPSCYVWERLVVSYVHEFTHTVEIGLPNIPYDYHEVLGYYSTPDGFERFGDNFHVEVANLFLLQQVEIDGKKIGIPYDFWRDEIYFNMTFLSTEGGHIKGNTNQQVKIGRSAETVMAVPNYGYRFIKWTSGHTKAELAYAPVLYRDHEITAIFEEIVIEFEYVDAERSSPEIWWTYHCETKYYKDFSSPLWLLELEGYDFEGWYLDKELSIPVGDKYGNVTEKDFEIFLNCAKKELYGVYRLYLYPKLVKIQD